MFCYFFFRDPGESCWSSMVSEDVPPKDFKGDSEEMSKKGRKGVAQAHELPGKPTLFWGTFGSNPLKTIRRKKTFAALKSFPRTA